jgi:hypothetical protein
MARVEFEPTIPAFERAQTVRALDRAATVIDLILLSRHNSGIDTPYVSMYYMFRPSVAIIRYTELLQSPFLLLYLPYSGQCLRIWSALYSNIFCIMPLCYGMY